MASLWGRKHDIRQCRFTRLDTLLFTYLLSRFFGVAPVAFRRDKPGSPISTSRLATLYSYLLIGILHISVVAAVVLDVRQDKRYVLRMRTASTGIVLVIEVALIMLINSIGCFNAPNRMKQVARYLWAIHKVNSRIDCNGCPKSCILSYFGNIFFILANFGLFVIHYYSLTVDAINFESDSKVLVLYTSFYLEFLMMMCLQLQFIWLAMVVADCFASLNNALEKLVLLTDRQLSNEETPQRVRRFMLSYGTICDVIAGINDCYGWLLVLFIFLSVWHFIFTPFNFLNYLRDKDRDVTRLFHHIAVLTFHFLYMLIIIEPGYTTEVQAERTHTLVKQLTQRVPCPEDPTAAELEVFLKQIHLNQPAYRPQRMCTISRRLITIIFGGSTTYLVIILQFQLQLDSIDW